jgi:hypothetical protein
MADLTTRLIQDTDNCAFLNSGRPEIDDWLENHAKRQHREKRVITYVWDQGEFILGYFSLTPHRLVDADISISGHAGGPLTGYLIAKIGIHQGAALEGDEITLANGDVVGPVPKPVQLIIDAFIAADSASEIGGGRYLFIDTTNEPPPILNALSAVGFQSITPADSPTYYITLLE